MTRLPQQRIINCLLGFFIFLATFYCITGEAGAAGFTNYSSNSCVFSVYSGATRTALRQEQGGHRLNFVNNSNEDIWLGVIGDDFTPKVKGWGFQHGYPGPNGTAVDHWKNSWLIKKSSTLSWCAPKTFASGRFWPRTGCKNVTVNGVTVLKCTTGDCLKDDKTPATDRENDICTISGSNSGSIVEFTINDPKSPQMVYYDLSFVDGYDFPIVIKTLKPDSKCPKQMGCDTLPETCLSVANGAFVSGVCPAPYVVFDYLPQNKYTNGSTAISATCADTKTKDKEGNDLCGCALNCDGNKQENRILRDNCPDTYTTYNPYENKQAVLQSSACSPVNKYDGVGVNKPQEVDPARFASFWNQTPCDPVTGEGSFFAPYLFDEKDITNPQGTRAVATKSPKNGTWQADEIIEIKATEFHGYKSTATTKVDLSSVTLKSVTVFIDRDEIADPKIDPNADQINTALLALDPTTRVVSFGLDKDNPDNSTITVKINSTSPVIGKNFPVTVNIANERFNCNPWPIVKVNEKNLYVDYVSTLRNQCRGAYTWQYDDLVGLGSCLDNDPKAVEQFEITFNPRPANALTSTDLIKFTAGMITDFPDALDTKELPLHMKLVINSVDFPVIGPDHLSIPLKATDSVSATVYCNIARNKAAVCSATYKGGGKFENIKGTSFCDAGFFGKIDANMQISPGRPAVEYCSDPEAKGDPVIVYPTGGIAFDVLVNTTPYTFAKGSTIAQPVTVSDGDILTVTAHCASPSGYTNTCKAKYNEGNKSFTLTEGAGQCAQIFTGAAATKEIRLLEPGLYCFDPTWSGDIVGFYPLSPITLNVKVSDGVTGNSKVDFTNSVILNNNLTQPFLIRMNSLDRLTLKQNCANKKTLLCTLTYKNDAGVKTLAVDEKASNKYCNTDGFKGKDYIKEVNGYIAVYLGTAESQNNCENNVTLGSTLEALQIAVGLHPYTDDHKNLDLAPLGPDGNPQGDGDIGVADALLQLKHLVGLYSW